MVQFVTILIGLADIVWAFFSPGRAWIPIGALAVLLGMVLAGAKRKKWRHVDGLSPAANAMIQEFGHFYAMPFAGRDFSSAATTVQFVSALVGVIGAFQGFWIGLGFALFSWFAFGWLAVSFNPTAFLRDPGEQAAHQEVIEWIQARSQHGEAP